MKRFLKAIVSKLDVSSAAARISAIAYSSDPKVVYRFNSRQGTDDVNKAFDGMRWQRGFTYTDKALLLAESDLFQTGNGMRQGVVKVNSIPLSTNIKYSDQLYCMQNKSFVIECRKLTILVHHKGKRQ